MRKETVSSVRALGMIQPVLSACSLGQSIWQRPSGKGALRRCIPLTARGFCLYAIPGERRAGKSKGRPEHMRGLCRSDHSFFRTFDSQLDKIVDQAVGSKRFKVTVRTKGGHSFNDFGRENAIERLAGIIGALYRDPDS